MSANDWRQACRMAFGAFAGWTLATLLAWPYAVYYAVYPLVLIGLAPAFDRHIALQFLVSAPTGMVAAGIMVAVLSTHPVVMTAAYLGFVSICFWLMTSPRKLFMFGALSLAISSGLVHYGSYPQMLWEELFWAACGSIVCSVALYYAAFTIFPDAEPRAPRVPPPRTPAQRRHIVLLCALGATGSFAFFQLFEMSDSLSAQMATVLILLALSHDGIWSAGRTRLYGSVIGSVHATLAQLAISGHSSFWPLTACAFLVGLIWFSAAHTREGIPGKGFAAVTALAILFGLLTPTDDMIQNSLYRGVSVVISITLMLVFISLLHRALNLFPHTRWTTEG
jgi:Predicted membrane protein